MSRRAAGTPEPALNQNVTIRGWQEGDGSVELVRSRDADAHPGTPARGRAGAPSTPDADGAATPAAGHAGTTMAGQPPGRSRNEVAMELIFLILALIVLDLAAARRGVSSIEDWNHPEWQRRKVWRGLGS